MRRCVNGLMHKGHARKHSAAAFGWAGNLCRSRHPAGNGDVASIPCQKSATPWLTATITNQDEPKNGEAWFVSLGRQDSTLTLTMRFQRRKCATLDADMRSCHFCSADALARIQMKRTIQVAGKRFTPTAEFHRRVRHGIAPRPQRCLGLGWMFVAAAVMVVVGP